MTTYLITFLNIENKERGEQFIKAKTKKDAIDIFRMVFKSDRFRITNIYKRLSI